MTIWREKYVPTWPWKKANSRDSEDLLRRIRDLETERQTHLAALQRSDQTISKVKSDLELRVQERTRELTQLNAFLDSIIENIPDMIFLKDAQQLRFVRFNRAGEDLLGYSRGELLGKNDKDFFPKEEADFFIKKDRETLEAGKVIDIPEETIMTRLKGPRVLRTKKIPVLDREGKPLYLLGISEDITEKKRAEAERIITERLRQSNLELEQFAYVASHDLQEPLRKITAFGDLLKVECHSLLNDKGRDYVERMQKAAARMQDLIEALLAYSRVSREAPQMSELHLDGVVKEVLGDLEMLIVKSRAKIQVGPLPRVKADRYRMRQLFQNLLSNAIKFTPKDAAPVVQVRAVPASQAGRVAIEIADRGVGFDMKDLDRIFQPFERLHSREDYDGTGVGLAICHRIVTRHGGAIRASSVPGEGTRFVVELPAAPPDKGGA